MDGLLFNTFKRRVFRLFRPCLWLVVWSNLQAGAQMILAKGMLHALKHDYCYTFLSQLLLVQCYQI